MKPDFWIKLCSDQSNINNFDMVCSIKMNQAYSFLFCYVASLDSRALFNDSSILRRSYAPVIVATSRVD
jgi:hypothetical protein